MRRHPLGPAVAPMLILVSLAGRAASQELRTSKDDSSAARLREMTELARAFTIENLDDAAGKPAEIVPDPIFRYNDPPNYIEDATLWVFGRPGRPAAALKVEIYPDKGIYGLVALSPGRIAAEGIDRPWAATVPGIELRSIPNAPAPARTPRERLAQLRDLSARFSAFEYAPTRGRSELRLLPKPILRYDDPGSGLQDGAIFSLSYGVNPEVLLLIESRNVAGATAPTWQYGLGRLGGAEASVSLDGREVWRQARALPVPQDRPTYMNRRLRRVPSEK